MAKFFAEPEHWRIGERILKQSIGEMSVDGAKNNEGVAMWLGHYEGTVAVVTHIGILRGPHVRKAPDQLLINSELINDLSDLAVANGVRLIGQIHSHGPLHGTYLSETDRRYGIAVPGMLSLVAPNYAQRPDTRLGECGVHIFQSGRGWRRFSTAEIKARLSLFPDAPANPLIAGE